MAELVVIPKAELEKLEAARVALYEFLEEQAKDTYFLVRLTNITAHIWNVANRKWPELMGRGEPVAERSPTSPGGINWLCDVLPERGAKLYLQPGPAVADGVPKGWRIEQDGEGFRVDSPDDYHIIVRKQDRAPGHYWENMLYELCKAMKEQSA